MQDGYKITMTYWQS